MLLLFSVSSFFREVWNHLWPSFSGSHAVRLSVCVGLLSRLRPALLPQHPDSKLRAKHAIVTKKEHCSYRIVGLDKPLTCKCS